jgi:purine-binding chemotaxis protein CheW
MATHQFIKFMVADLTFGIEITQIHQILKPQQIFKVPNTAPYIEGLLNLRGRVLTVFNLRKRFALPEKENDDNTKIIIVTMDEFLLGFIVDSVTEIVRVPDEEIEPTPPSLQGLDKRFLSGVAKVDEHVILLLDLTKVLTTQEEKDMADMLEKHAAKVN